MIFYTTIERVCIKKSVNFRNDHINRYQNIAFLRGNFKYSYHWSKYHGLSHSLAVNNSINVQYNLI